MVSRLRSGTTLGWRLPSRSRSVGGTMGQPPRARILVYWPTASSVVFSVAGDSVGRLALGMWMVREALSKSRPISRC